MPDAAGQGWVLRLSFPVIQGRNYTIEARDDLSPGTLWRALPGAPHNTGSAVETDLLKQRYYRVRVE